MIKKIKQFFKRMQQKKIIDKEFKNFEKDFSNLPIGEQFAMQTFDIVELLWNGKKLKFVIGNINALELITCGRFPNIMNTYNNENLKILEHLDEENRLEVDIKEVQKEESILYEELCRKTMIKPTYEEVYTSIIKVKKSLDVAFNPTSIKDVLPHDFLNALLNYHLNRILDTIKKNLNTQMSIALDALQNTTTKNPLHTSLN
ncbi:MAG: hypothetical protein ACTTKH_04465 [Treponema sp.]